MIMSEWVYWKNYARDSLPPFMLTQDLFHARHIQKKINSTERKKELEGAYPWRAYKVISIFIRILYSHQINKYYWAFIACKILYQKVKMSLDPIRAYHLAVETRMKEAIIEE